MSSKGAWPQLFWVCALLRVTLESIHAHNTGRKSVTPIRPKKWQCNCLFSVMNTEIVKYGDVRSWLVASMFAAAAVSLDSQREYVEWIPKVEQLWDKRLLELKRLSLFFCFCFFWRGDQLEVRRVHFPTFCFCLVHLSQDFIKLPIGFPWNLRVEK